MTLVILFQSLSRTSTSKAAENNVTSLTINVDLSKPVEIYRIEGPDEVATRDTNC